MKKLLLFLTLLLLHSQTHAQPSVWVEQIKVFPLGFNALDTIRVVTLFNVAEDQGYRQFVNTSTVGNVVTRTVCLAFPPTTISLPSVMFLKDTVTLLPLGSGGRYEFIFILNASEDTSTCDTPYQTVLDTMIIEVDTPAGIESSAEADIAFKAWPNPITGNTMTLSPLPSPTAILHLTDLTGRSVPFRRSGVVLYLEGLSPGVYLLHLRDGDRRYTAKLIKQ